MIKVSFYTDSRDSYIRVFHELDKLLRTFCPDQQTVLDLNGDEKSGKSLGALAMHFSRANKAENPPQIPSDDFVTGDDRLSESRAGTVVFKNFGNDVQASKEGYDSTLREFAERNPQAKLVIAANICRTFMGNYDYDAYGLDSDMLDIGILVHMTKTPEKLIPDSNEENLMRYFQNTLRNFNHETSSLTPHEREEVWRETFWRRIDIFLPDDHPITEHLLALKDSLKIDTTQRNEL